MWSVDEGDHCLACQETASALNICELILTVACKGWDKDHDRTHMCCPPSGVMAMLAMQGVVEVMKKGAVKNISISTGTPVLPTLWGL